MKNNAPTILKQDFFDRDTVKVARELLGKVLVRQKKNARIALVITEVEAYDGFKDRASHAIRGKTKRTAPMFGPPGHWFVYFTYGMHWMLNAVTREEGYPAAVLIRGVQGIGGPARVSKFLEVDKDFNRKSIARRSGLWIEDRGDKISDSDIIAGSRIGVSYAGRYWARRKLRYYIS